MGRIFFVTLSTLSLFSLLVSSEAHAGPFRRRSSVSSSRPNIDTSTCASVASYMASTGRMKHCGNPTETHEGVGFSTYSAQDALDRCCYSSSGMEVVDSAVARGSRGWYAIKRYSSAR